MFLLFKRNNKKRCKEIMLFWKAHFFEKKYLKNGVWKHESASTIKNLTLVKICQVNVSQNSN